MVPPDWELRAAELGQKIRDFDAQQAFANAKVRFAQFSDYMLATPNVGAHTTWPARWLRPKGNLTRLELGLLLSVAALPLAMMVVRISAWPGAMSPGMSGSFISSIGQDLNQMLSLSGIPAGDRSRVLYMLFLPMGAMLIALARLTFGVRVIGFRAILISVGFQESGIVPSLILILVMVLIVLSVRPTLVRIRLPYYARVSVIMSLACVVLLAAVMLAPWMRSDLLWGVAFFPVIVLGLLAEGIAKTLDSGSGFTAAWRTGMTIGIALVLAGVSQIPILREIALEFPELVLTQIVAIVLISEYLDLRLFQSWDAKLSGMAMPRLFATNDAFRIAVVRNHRRGGIVGRMGAPSRGEYRRSHIRRIVKSLGEVGHSVKTIEGDMSLLSKLRDFMPSDPSSEQPGGIVLNLSHGIQGETSSTHVPAMLEMGGVAYTGPSQLGLTIAQDRMIASSMLAGAGVPTPTCHVVDGARADLDALPYPVVVKPRNASRYRLRIANNRSELGEAVRIVTRRHQQDSVCEAFVEGRDFEVAILGNDPARCLPIVEILPGNKEQVCPAIVDESVASQVREVALAAFKACEGRDYAVVNLRLTNDGTPVVLEVGTSRIFSEDGSFALAAEIAGLSSNQWVEEVITIARERYRVDDRLPSLEVVAGDEDPAKGRSLVAG